MPVYSRNLLLFSGLAATALLSWVLARNTGRPADDVPAGAERAPEGYYLRDTVLSRTGDSGEFQVRIHAERVEQASSAHDFRLEQVRVEYPGESDVAWDLTAARGVLTRDHMHLNLSVVRLAARTGADAAGLVFEARDLSFNLRDQTAVTRQPVRLRTGQCESNARGLNVDLNTDTYELLEMAATCRPRPRSEPLAVLALVAGAAVAQSEPASETYTLTCGAVSGDLRAETGLCTDLVITDKGSFRLTAGRLTLLDAEATRFDPSEWLENGELQLTDGVRLELETAVLIAESALFVFDADRQLRSFDMSGMPAELSDFIEGRTMPFRVTAARILYDEDSRTLKMPGEFEFLEDGAEGSAGSACDLVYRLEDKTYDIGNPQCGFSLSLSPLGTESSTEAIPDEP